MEKKENGKGKRKIVQVLEILLLIAALAAPVLWLCRDKIGQIHVDFAGVMQDIKVIFSGSNHNSRPLTAEEEEMRKEIEKYAGDPYVSVTRELKEDGEELRLEFGPGRYVVGGHIPEGSYRISGSEVCDNRIDVKDEENKIDHFWDLQFDAKQGESGLYVEDVRLYKGAQVLISGSEKLVFYTQNGQPEEMESGEKNPLTKEVEFREQEMYAGEDFEPGVYDIVVKEGGGSVGVTWAGAYENYYLSAAGKEYYTDRACNLELTEGTKVAQSDIDQMNARIVLVPSEKVFPKE